MMVATIFTIIFIGILLIIIICFQAREREYFRQREERFFQEDICEIDCEEEAERHRRDEEERQRIKELIRMDLRNMRMNAAQNEDGRQRGAADEYIDRRLAAESAARQAEKQRHQDKVSQGRDWASQERAKLTFRLRHKILQRDGLRCQRCGASSSDGVRLEVDHRIPVSKGGKTEESNLWTLCMPCNRGKYTDIL